MPTPDASQFTRFKKYAAVDSRGDNGVKVFTHLYQPLPSVRQPLDFLPQISGQVTYASPLTFLGRNYAAGHGTVYTKVYSPPGVVTAKYIR
jgi:hypothetical protein